MGIPEGAIDPKLFEAYLARLNQLASVRVAQPNLQAAREAVQELPVDENYFAAWERIDEIVENEPEIAWPLLLEIVDRAAEGSLHIVGAGPLEDFLVAHSREYQDAISEQLRSNARFRRAFQMAYLYDLPEEIWRHFNSVLITIGVPPEDVRDWSR
jgi:hypothetical protein